MSPNCIALNVVEGGPKSVFVSRGSQLYLNVGNSSYSLQIQETDAVNYISFISSFREKFRPTSLCGRSRPTDDRPQRHHRRLKSQTRRRIRYC